MAAPSTTPALPSIGNAAQLQILFRAVSSDGVTTTLQAIAVAGGCLVRTLTQLQTAGSSALSEALVFLPNVRIEPDVSGGHKLLPER